MSGMFQLIEGEIAVVYERGIFKEVQVATRNGGELYVKMRGGFARVYADGSTSAGSACRLDTLALDGPLYKDRLGKLCVAPGEGRAALTQTPSFLPVEGT